MAITRTPIIDDDGSGQTGTVIDNAWKQEFYDQIDAFVGIQLQTYTPTWTTGGVAATVGNGTLVGTYARLGPLIYFYLHLTLGSGTAVGNSGDWVFGLPMTLTDGMVAFQGIAFNGGQIWDLASHSIGLGSQFIPMITGASPLNSVNNTRPFNWGAGHHLGMWGLYY